MARSNRELTQFAVTAIKEFIYSQPTGKTVTRKRGNTSVTELPATTFSRQIRVDLFGSEICKITESHLPGNGPVFISLRAGNYYDSKDRPTRTTRERLNGLLDFLGSAKIIPEGVRVFLDGDDCYIGKGDDRKPFGKKEPYARIISSQSKLVFAKIKHRQTSLTG